MLPVLPRSIRGNRGNRLARPSVRAVLYEAMTTNPVYGSRFVMEFLGKIRACVGTVASYLLAKFATHET